MEAINLLAQTEAILLDPVYSSKGMSGLIDHIRQGRSAKMKRWCSCTLEETRPFRVQPGVELDRRTDAVTFNVKRRGKVTYYYEGDRPVLSALVTEEQSDGDLKIYFSGLTGALLSEGRARTGRARDDGSDSRGAARLPLLGEVATRCRPRRVARRRRLPGDPRLCLPAQDAQPVCRPGRLCRRAGAPADGLSPGLRRVLRRSPARQRIARRASRCRSSTCPTRRPRTSSMQPRCCSAAAGTTQADAAWPVPRTNSGPSYMATSYTPKTRLTLGSDEQLARGAVARAVLLGAICAHVTAADARRPRTDQVWIGVELR